MLLNSSASCIPVFNNKFALFFLDTILCDKACQWLVAGRWFSPGPPVSTTNKTNRHDIAKILLKVALNECRTFRPRTFRPWTFWLRFFAKVDVSAKQYLVVIYMLGFFFIRSCSPIANILYIVVGFFFLSLGVRWGGMGREGPWGPRLYYLFQDLF
jgi:hypothetical protein